MLRIGVLASGTAVLLALVALVAHAVPAHAQYDDCGFPPYTDDRRIALRPHVSCSEAKRVLPRLTGDRPSRTVPMVCRHSRVAPQHDPRASPIAHEPAAPDRVRMRVLPHALP